MYSVPTHGFVPKNNTRLGLNPNSGVGVVSNPKVSPPFFCVSSGVQF